MPREGRHRDGVPQDLGADRGGAPQDPGADRGSLDKAGIHASGLTEDGLCVLDKQ